MTLTRLPFRHGFKFLSAVSKLALLAKLAETLLVLLTKSSLSEQELQLHGALLVIAGLWVCSPCL